jgi:mannose-6-phosphate isomerase-like protein (cupin superfamily)
MGNETGHRPWGYYEVLSGGLDHKVKRITVYPGKRLSLQRHRRRAEHWFVLQGDALVMLGGKEVSLKKGESADIPQGEAHRIANIGTTLLAFVEVQTGEYFGEDDIERIEDDYGRV